MTYVENRGLLFCRLPIPILCPYQNDVYIQLPGFTVIGMSADLSLELKFMLAGRGRGLIANGFCETGRGSNGGACMPPVKYFCGLISRKTPVDHS